MSSAFQVKKKPASPLDNIDEPTINKPSENYGDKTEAQVGMTFNMPKSWHTEFKTTASSRGMSMRDFLMEVFDNWKLTQG